MKRLALILASVITIATPGTVQAKGLKPVRAVKTVIRAVFNGCKKAGQRVYEQATYTPLAVSNYLESADYGEFLQASGVGVYWPTTGK